jgi:hypothetical protein
MKIVWTKNWQIPPKPYYMFRVGTGIYKCRWAFWHFAIIEEVV